MSDHPDPEHWWGGESPVDTDRRVDDVPPVPGRSQDRRDDVPPAPTRSRLDDVPPVPGRSRDRLDDVPPAPTRSRAQVFVPAPEDLPPLDEFGDPIVDAPPVPAAPAA
ncbi:MAG TPA: hypothetical protein VFP06_09135, partial [Acidimicrobiales bacterium]|nr:hypothetical protein [Acidimicrobiales bacterium]